MYLLQDINQNRSVAEALLSEEQFFHDNPVILTSPDYSIALSHKIVLNWFRDISHLFIEIHVEDI